jgi:hypothetical protein
VLPHAITCPTALDPASLLMRAPGCHMSHGFGPCLPAEEALVLLRVLWLQPHLPAEEGSGADAYPMALDPPSC